MANAKLCIISPLLPESESLYDEVLARDAARKANRPTDGR